MRKSSAYPPRLVKASVVGLFLAFTGPVSLNATPSDPPNDVFLEDAFQSDDVQSWVNILAA